MASLAARIAAAGKIPATISASPDQARRRVDEGYQMVSLLADLAFARNAAAESVAELRRRDLI